jgi:hypothetical protein
MMGFARAQSILRAVASWPENMHVVEIDATGWKTSDDFYDALLAALGSPPWHGRNVNALIDSMVWGGINALEPPYRVRVRGTSHLPKEIHAEIEMLKEDLGRARAEFSERPGGKMEVYFDSDS